MRFWGDTFQGDDSYRRLTRCVLLFGVIFLFVTCMLGFHSHSMAHSDAHTPTSSTVDIVDSGSNDSGVACAGCEEHGTDSGVMLLCTMVLIAALSVALMRSGRSLILSRLTRFLLRTVDPPSTPRRHTPSLVLLSISRT